MTPVKTWRITYAIAGSEIERSTVAGGISETEVRGLWDRVFPHRIILRMVAIVSEPEWMRAFCRCQITDADRRAFAAIEAPAVSPTLDR